MAAIHAASFTTPRPWSAREIADILSSPLCFLLAESDGFLIGRAVAGEAELLTLAVAPASRRNGQGARLVQGFVQQAAILGADRAFLEVAADNAAALALYRSTGFVETGRRRGYYVTATGAAVDAITMSRPIALQHPTKT